MRLPTHTPRQIWHSRKLQASKSMLVGTRLLSPAAEPDFDTLDLSSHPGRYWEEADFNSCSTGPGLSERASARRREASDSTKPLTG